MNRYFSSFFITTTIYLITSFCLFYILTDTFIIKEEPKEIKISLKDVISQKEQILEEKIPTKIEPIQEISTPLKKKMEKPKEDKTKDNKKVEQNNQLKEPIVEKIEKINEEIKSNLEDKEETINKRVNTDEIKNIENMYLGKVRNLIEENKIYPNIAKRLNQVGKVYVTFTIMSNGEIKNCRITNSSQFESLDKASISIFAKIGSFDAIPKELDKDSWEITIPIVYQIY